MKGIFTSRKFWMTISVIATSIGAAFGGEITWLQAIQAITAAAFGYVIGTAVEDAGQARAKALADNIAKAATKLVPLLLVGVLMCGFCGSAAQAQIVTTQVITVPQVRSIAFTPPEQALVSRNFALTYFKDGETHALGAPIAKWSIGRLHVDFVPVIATGTTTEIGFVQPICYDIDCTKLLARLGLEGVTLTITPRYGPMEINGAKPHAVWGGTIAVGWKL